MFCLQAPSHTSSQRSRQSEVEDSDAESHTAPVEEADDSLVEAGSTRSQGSRSRSTSAKRGKGDGKGRTVVDVLESMLHQTSCAQTQMEQKVNICNK